MDSSLPKIAEGTDEKTGIVEDAFQDEHILGPEQSQLCCVSTVWQTIWYVASNLLILTHLSFIKQALFSHFTEKETEIQKNLTG